ncbi:hypothetical protein [Nostoc sp.]
MGVTYPTINRWENGRATPLALAIYLCLASLNRLHKQI